MMYTPIPCHINPGFVPPPPPPPPVRHPDLWGDEDGYSRKEIDDLVSGAVTTAKAYTDGCIAELSGLASGAAESAAQAAETLSGIEDAVSVTSGLASAAAEAAANAEALASGAAALTSGLVLESGALWYYNRISTSVNHGQWKKFKAKSSGSHSIPTAYEFNAVPATSGIGFSTQSGQKVMQWGALDAMSGVDWAACLSGNRIEIYRKGSGEEVFSGTPTVVVEDIDSVTVGGKVFANYRGDTTDFHWTDAPFRVKIAGVAFSDAFDPES